MLDRLLVTGAAGRVGQELVPLLRPLARRLRLSDIVPIKDADPADEVVACQLGDATAVNCLVQGCAGIVHLGGIARESPIDQVIEANILGVFNLYQAAKNQGKPRIAFASSNHAVGFYPWHEVLTGDEPPRPDTLYGASKVWGEGLARMYFDKFGQESALIRIGSAFPEPRNERMLTTWFSARDFALLLDRVFSVPKLGCPVIWGVSANDGAKWDNSNLDWLGWKPRDNGADYAGRVEASPAGPGDAYHGGFFTQLPIGSMDR